MILSKLSKKNSLYVCRIIINRNKPKIEYKLLGNEVLDWKNKCKNNTNEINKYFIKFDKFILLKFKRIGKISKNIKNLS